MLRRTMIATRLARQRRHYCADRARAALQYRDCGRDGTNALLATFSNKSDETGNDDESAIPSMLPRPLAPPTTAASGAACRISGERRSTP
ncbi:MAG TPA: hypothetical protein VN641_11265 [Urbifossiella sp.]|nr:hypothetical protein [Urbifossiella sp.]